MTTDDALSRLSAGLDRDEQLARAAADVDDEGVAWQVRKVCDDGMYVFGEHQAIPPNGKGERLRLVDDAQTHHIEAHDPARTLQQVQAIRKVIDAYRSAVLAKEQGSISPRNVAQDEAAVDVLGYAIEALASIYADPAETGGDS